MNKAVCLALSTAWLAGPAFASDPRAGSAEVGGYGGYAWLSSDNQLGNAGGPAQRPGSGPVAGLRASWHLLQTVAVEVDADYTGGSFADSGLSSALVGWRGSVLWEFASVGMRPFVAVGAGSVATLWKEYGTEHDIDLAGHVGAGLKIDLGKDWGARADVRYVALDGADARLAHNFVALLGLWMRLGSREPDADADGVPDSADKCPQAAEDKDSFEDGDGCAELDDDGDGIADTADKCRTQAEDKDGFADDDGCPDPDDDADGLLDAADKCPRIAEDKDGFEDGDGCPEADNDKDGVADTTDKCPNQAGKAEDQGCPPADQDEDGIPDKADKCPDKKETFNGKDDDDGCPDGEQTVVVTKGAIEIRQKVYFALGTADIKAESHRLLNTVAAALAQHQRLTKVAVEGHTDDVGVAADNQALSQKRAEAVVAHLVAQKVAPGRLVATGFGATRPLCGDLAKLLESEAKNKKKIESCRDHNRRVQFQVVEVDGVAVPLADTATPAGR